MSTDGDATVPSSIVRRNSIPAIEFVEDVDAFLKKEGDLSIEQAIRKLETTHHKYRYLEQNMMAQRQRYKNKLPELRNSLQMLEVLNEKMASNESMTTKFELSDQVYCTATIPPTDRVCLWLGANVMLEYRNDEARDLLERNIASADKGVADLSADLDFIKDQLTTTEVNIARVYNHGVQRRKANNTVAISS